jgi:hypothetical protein
VLAISVPVHPAELLAKVAANGTRVVIQSESERGAEGRRRKGWFVTGRVDFINEDSDDLFVHTCPGMLDILTNLLHAITQVSSGT